MSPMGVWQFDPDQIRIALVMERKGGPSVRRMSGLMFLGLMISVALLKGPATAEAAEPLPFATASAPCSEGLTRVPFPVQPSSHPNVIYQFRSIGAEGSIAFFFSGAGFSPGDSGWGTYDVDGGVQAGIAPGLDAICESGSVEASLADRPTTPTTFSGDTTAGNSSFLPFSAPGNGQYVLDLSILQGAVKISRISGILQSSGTYSLGSLPAGPETLSIEAEPGPPGVWSATIRMVPVAINGLSFGRGCIAAGEGVPAKFSVTGDTNISAAIEDHSGTLVRNLGTFPVEQGESSIPWDGRNAGGGPVANGRYVLTLISKDPQGDVTSARTGVSVASSAPRVRALARRSISRKHSLILKVSNDPCGVSRIKVKINGRLLRTYRRNAVKGNGRLLVVPRGSWRLGKNRWRAVSTDQVGNRRVSTGIFRVKRSGSRRRPRVLCLVDWGTIDGEVKPTGTYRVRPKACDLLKRGATAGFRGTLAITKKLRWRHWGPRNATARGRLGISTVSVPIHIKLRLTRPRMECGRTVFTKAIVKQWFRSNGRKQRNRWTMPLTGCLA